MMTIIKNWRVRRLQDKLLAAREEHEKYKNAALAREKRGANDRSLTKENAIIAGKAAKRANKISAKLRELGVKF